MASDSRPDRTIRLRDGSVAVVRSIDPSDKQLLVRGFERLSPESRYRRFLSPLKHLSSAELAYLTEVDHVDHEALIAVSSENGELVGVARYVRLPDRPETAEVAVTTVDAWQGRGLATELLRRLAERAGSAGIERFTATCLAQNRDVIDLLQRAGASTVARSDPGLVEVEVELPPSEDSAHPARRVLRHAATGEVNFRGRVG